MLTAVLLAVTTAGCTGSSGGSGSASNPNPGETTHAQAPTPASAQANAQGNAEAAARQQLTWKACPPPTTAESGSSSGRAPGPDWECATLHAPLDYARPMSNSNTIDIALIRAKATDQARRIGSLVFNFGGPGGSGITTLPAFADDYKELRTRYDLVSFDPRGVGRSSGVVCLDDRQLDAYYAADAAPATAQEEKALVDRVTAYAAACERRSGRVLPHVGTENAARDMDLMRQVLGDAKLHYFGVSYGTELGGVYAHLFPDKVGRALFDGVVDPGADPVQSALAQAQGFQLALTNYMEACTKTADNCPTEGQIGSLLRRLAEKPIPGAAGRDLTRSLATGGIAQSLYSKDFWDYLTEGIEDAENGDGRLLLSLGDAMNGRGQDGRYSTLQSSLNAITCADFAQRYTAAEIEQHVPAFRKASSVFGDFMAWSLTQCTGWPVKGAWQTPDVSAKGSAPILVVGNTGDPATPYEGAKRMAQELGPGVAAVLTFRGEGHGAYDSGNACVKGAVNAYLLDGTVPETDKICS
ncbi:alpha/beta hydrolase [Streptomyces hiroshimensis]|uniref:Peptidase n=1 Tax=Streptomyces hiroshimensis TaxID=66424 RepID=A0ABQ2YQ03_9ACTN|nr:peptidase [Streptomyces hiroshimensis]